MLRKDLDVIYATLRTMVQCAFGILVAQMAIDPRLESVDWRALVIASLMAGAAYVLGFKARRGDPHAILVSRKPRTPEDD